VTIEGVAHGFELRVVRHPEIERRMRQRLGADINEARLRMANVPEGAELLATEALFAPIIKIRNVFIFPGIPRILQERFHAIKERFRDAPFYLKNVYVKYGEGIIADPMNQLVAKYPDLMVGSYPVLDAPDYKVKVTLESKDAAYLDRALTNFLAALPGDAVHRIE
jgi:molybdopterin-biosynthesis enzyme MoeA-like protein